LNQSLQDLLSVQDLDIALDQLRHRKANLPERQELSRLDTDAVRLRDELAQADAARAEVAERQARAEAELAATLERSGAVDKRLYGGDVTASRDLEAMSAELEHLKARTSTLEDTVLELLEELDPLDSRTDELRSSLDGVATTRTEVVGRMEEAEVGLDEEMAGVAGQRREAAARVPDGLLATYERLRARLGGVGIARLVGNHCDGCHLTLSAVELDQVRHLPEGEVYTCEQCSRILVP
jgi:predicted  nucleic acid-binding Zn-ribbon protein